MPPKITYSRIIKQVLSKIKPTLGEKKRFKDASDKFIQKLEVHVSKSNIKANFSIGGSVAKNTQLKNAKDIDLFVKYPPVPYAHKDISKITHELLKKEFIGIKRIHATRDYFHVYYNNILFEIIPVIEITSASMQHRIMDASPHHVTYVNDNLKNSDEVRLLKKFLSAQKLYGAESHIRGFSGYVCELLTIKYGTFSKLLSEVSKWNPAFTFIDMESYYSDLENAKNTINVGEQTPLIIIDPVQSNRNASASIDEKTYRTFIRVCQIFKKTPSLSAFSKPLIKYKGSGILLTINDTKKKDDTLPSKLRSLHERLVRELSEFIITGEDWDYDSENRKWQSKIWLGTYLLPKIVEIQGPPLSLNFSVDAFRQKHKETIERETRIYALENRKIRTPEQKIKEIIKGSKHFPKNLKIKIERRKKL